MKQHFTLSIAIGLFVINALMFVQSLHGISHNKVEDTREDHLEMAVTAFDKLAQKTMAWMNC